MVYFGILCMMIYAMGTGTDCQFLTIQLPIDDSACETEEHINISVTKHHHCSMACIHSKECQATIHDTSRSICMLLLELSAQTKFTPHGPDFPITMCHLSP